VDGIQHIDKIIDIDQSPIGRTPRSNPATYTGLFTLIRDLFTKLPEAQIRGYKQGVQFQRERRQDAKIVKAMGFGKSNEFFTGCLCAL